MSVCVQVCRVHVCMCVCVHFCMYVYMYVWFVCMFDYYCESIVVCSYIHMCNRLPDPVFSILISMFIYVSHTGIRVQL